MTKIFFSDNVEWRSRNLSKMVSVDVTANVKQQETNYQVAVSYTLSQGVPSKLEIQCKKGMYF